MLHGIIETFSWDTSTLEDIWAFMDIVLHDAAMHLPLISAVKKGVYCQMAVQSTASLCDNGA